MLRAVSDEQLQGIADATKLKSGDDTPMSVEDIALRIGLIDVGGLQYVGETTVDMSTQYGAMVLPEYDKSGEHAYILLPRAGAFALTAAPLVILINTQNPRFDGVYPTYKINTLIVRYSGYADTINDNKDTRYRIDGTSTRPFNSNSIYDMYQIR